MARAVLMGMDIPRSLLHRRPRRMIPMPLPPRHDPSRPLLSSARSARGIGILQICLAFIIMILAMFISQRADQLIGTCAVCGILALPGMLSVLFAHYIKRSRRWAIIAMIVLASLEMLIVAPF